MPSVNLNSGMGPKILAVATALPPYTRSTTDILPRVETWLQDMGLGERDRRKILRIFQYAQVDRRYSIMDMEEVFEESSFEDKNRFFCEQAVKLGRQALEAALDKANLTPQDIDYIITVSCTGFMIPSMDAEIINQLQMRRDVVRLPVTEMGCAAGTSALIYANEFLKANPDKRAAVIAVESPTSTFQHRDLRMTNMVSAAIFGDGAACAILGPDEGLAPRIVDTDMYHYYDALHFMGYNVRNTGFEMVLDVSVPEEIEKQFPEILHPFLARNGLTVEQVDHFIFHPGGKKIVQMVEGLLHGLGKQIDDSKSVLRDFGNMSSATVLYVLARCMERQPTAGDRGLMLAFGPGFSAQRLLLEWEA